MKNKKYHVCGLGNALADIQYNIEDADLAALSLKKGDMQLADALAQADLLKKFTNREKNICSGGSAANTVIAFSAMGGKAAYQTMLGEDENGMFYSSEFDRLGIDLQAGRTKEHPTGTCVVLITPDGERTMHTHLGATSRFSLDVLDEEMIRDSELLYIEGYKLSEPESTKAILKALDTAKAGGTKIAFSFSAMFIIETQRETVEKITQASDIIFCNDDEALTYSRENTIEKAKEKIASDCPNFVITLGKDGALIRKDGKEFTVPCYNDSPIDTTGAGDMFAAGFLYGDIVEKNPEFAGKLGSYAAGKIVGQYGARFDGNFKEIIEYVKSNLA